jgi:hypothetical protein
MAVYERRYSPYEGTLTPRKTRFLVLPAYSYKEILSSKMFLVFLAAWGLWTLLVLPILIYLPHNLGFLEKFGLDSEAVKGVFNFDAKFFFGWFMVPAMVVSYLSALVVGPALVSADMRNNGLPLYLARPFGRWEYVLGKSAVMLILLSAITWIPGLFLFAFQSYMEGWSWFSGNLGVAVGIFFTSWIWILQLCVISLALSAYLKWKPVARLALILIFVIMPRIGDVLNLLLGTSWGSVMDLLKMTGIIATGMFGIAARSSVPLPVAWLSLIVFCAVCVGLMAKKVRAYEVVKS